MSKLSFYKITSIVLFILNIALILYLFFKPPFSQRGWNPNDHPAKREMNLTAEQNEQFLSSANKHKIKIKELNSNLHKVLNGYFEPLKAMNNPVSATQDSLLAQIQMLEREKLDITYKHFEEIKSFLKPEQLNAYNQFISKALMKILNGNVHKSDKPF